MTTQIVQFTNDVKSHADEFQSALPVGMDVKRFVRTVINGISTHAQAEQLLQADRQTLFRACTKAASDGLMLDGKEATLTAFYSKKKQQTEVVYMPMVQGLVKLARNSGEIKNIISEVVYRNDKFQYRPGVDEQPMHAPDWFGDRGEPVGAYAVVTTSGEKIVSVLPRQRIMAVANAGKNSYQYDPVQGQFFEEWWKKTAIKNVLKYAPKSNHLEDAIRHDNEQYGYHGERDVTPPKKQAENATLYRLAGQQEDNRQVAHGGAERPPEPTEPTEATEQESMCTEASELMDGAGTIQELQEIFSQYWRKLSGHKDWQGTLQQLYEDCKANL